MFIFVLFFGVAVIQRSSPLSSSLLLSEEPSLGRGPAANRTKDLHDGRQACQSLSYATPTLNPTMKLSLEVFLSNDLYILF
jgi:hypothetical protein